MKTKTFDAVTESRRWKAAVAQKTQGMTREQVLGFFAKDKALAAIARIREIAVGGSCVVREEPPKP